MDVRTTDNIVKPIVEFTSGSINWINNENLPKIRHLPKSKLAENNNYIKLVKNEKYFVKSLQQSTLTPWYLVLILSLILLFLSWYRETK